MSTRFRNFLGSGSKRRSDSNNVLPSASSASLASTSPALNGTVTANSSVDLTSNSTSQTTNPPPPTAAPPTPPTQHANTMNIGGQQPPGQPPAYNQLTQQQLGGQAPHPPPGRSSPMPPPINTNMQYGHPGQQSMYSQQGPSGPPGYPAQGQPPYGYAQQPMAHGGGGHALYGRAEVEGSQRSKAQLIVGIDFVRLRTIPTANIG